MTNVAIGDQVASEQDLDTFYAPDSPVEFVLFGYAGESRVVLAQQSPDVSLSLVGFCMSEWAGQERVGNRVFHQVESSPLPILTEHDDRPKSLKFGWVSDRELSDGDREVVRRMLDQFGVDLHGALTSKQRSHGLVRKYLGPVIYACERNEAPSDKQLSHTAWRRYWVSLVVGSYFLLLLLMLVGIILSIIFSTDRAEHIIGVSLGLLGISVAVVFLGLFGLGIGVRAQLAEADDRRRIPRGFA